MRILLACEFYSPSVGGVQEVMRQVAERLVQRGHTVRVATSALPARRERMINGVEILEFAVSGNAVRGIEGEADRYRDVVLAGDYDVLMIKAAQQWTFDALIPVLDRIRPPKVFVPCGFSGLYHPDFAAYFRDMPALLAKFDRLVFYASRYRDIEFARSHGLSNFTLIPNGASEDEFNAPPPPGFRARHGIDENAFLVLTVGTLNGFKGHLELAQAFRVADFGTKPAHLLLNGNAPRVGPAAPAPPPPAESRLARAAHILRTQGTAALITRGGRAVGRRLLRAPVPSPPARGPDTVESVVAAINAQGAGRYAAVVDLPRPELVAAYFAADLFVFASHVEYSPLVLFEAAASGTPFLSVPAGNAAEIAEWTGGGTICPAERDQFGNILVDPDVLAHEMERVTRDRDALAARGALGRRNWQERFTWGRIAGQYEAMFASLAGKAE